MRLRHRHGEGAARVRAQAVRDLGLDAAVAQAAKRPHAGHELQSCDAKQKDKEKSGPVIEGKVVIKPPPAAPLEVKVAAAAPTPPPPIAAGEPPKKKRKLLILDRNALTETLPGKHVELFDFGEDRLEVRWNNVSLPYRVFDKDQRVKELTAALLAE